MLREKNPVTTNSIYLVSQESCCARVYWHVADAQRLMARLRGGKQLVLRIFDVTDINIDREMPHSVQQFSCTETDSNWMVSVPEAGDYVAEIGYDTSTGEWLSLARSAPVFISGASRLSQLHYSYS